MKSPGSLMALAVLLGFCIGKPPEATRLATSPSFGLPRSASSYLPRKQQRVRLAPAGTTTEATLRTHPRGPKAALLSRLPDDASRPGMPLTPSPIRPRSGEGAMSHPLRC
jgi:hypothetical protein